MKKKQSKINLNITKEDFFAAVRGQNEGAKDALSHPIFAAMFGQDTVDKVKARIENDLKNLPKE